MAVAGAVLLSNLLAAALNAVQRIQTAVPTGMCCNETKLCIADAAVAGK